MVPTQMDERPPVPGGRGSCSFTRNSVSIYLATPGTVGSVGTPFPVPPMPQHLVFTLTAGRTGTAWLRALLGLNLPQAEAHHEILGRNPVSVVASMTQRGDMANLGKQWPGYLDPDYPQNIIDPAVFKPHGLGGGARVARAGDRRAAGPLRGAAGRTGRRARRHRDPAAEATTPAEAVKTTYTGRAIAYGLGAGLVGFFAGALIGAEVHEGEGELVDLAAAVVGGSILGGLILPLGVHLGNRRQGNLPLVMAASVATGLAGWGAAWVANDGHVALLTPALQIVASILVETATTPASTSPPQPTDPPPGPHRWDIGLAPAIGPRQVGLVVSGSF